MNHAIPPSLPNSKELAIQQIDDEIQSLNQRLRLLKSQRNTYSITYTLPTEVLCEIFTIVQAQSKRQNRTLTAYKSWISISHVSLHWRKVAVESSQLWCEIDGTVPVAAMLEFLERSGGRGIYLNIISMYMPQSQPRGFATRSFQESVLPHLTTQAFRIQHLSVKSHISLLSIRGITSLPAPQLLTLDLSSSEVPFHGQEVNIPDDMFQGSTPQLKTLRLSGCRFSQTSPLFRLNGLTTLDISGCGIGSTTVWLEIVKRMPRLVHLSIVSSFVDQVQDGQGVNLNGPYTPLPPVPNDFGVINLSQLTSLVIEGSNLITDLDFLAHLTFPSHVSLKFSSHIHRHKEPYETITPPLVAFLRVHAQARQDISKLKFTTLKWETDKERSSARRTVVCFVASQDVLGESQAQAQAQTQTYLDVCLDGLRMTGCDDGHLAEIASLPISGVTSFITDRIHIPRHWKALSHLFPNVQKISTSRWSVESLVATLGADSVAFDASGNRDELRWSYRSSEDIPLDLRWSLKNPLLRNDEQPFHLLRSVRFDSISFRDWMKVDILGGFRARREVGFRVEEVIFDQCSDVENGLVEKLKSYVDVVHWIEPQNDDDEGDW